MSPVITRRDFTRTVGFVVVATSVASCTSPPPPAALASPLLAVDGRLRYSTNRRHCSSR